MNNAQHQVEVELSREVWAERFEQSFVHNPFEYSKVETLVAIFQNRSVFGFLVVSFDWEN